MKTKFTLFVTLILFINYSFTQEICGTDIPVIDQSYSSLSRMLNGTASNEPDICLNVFFHIVRDDNGLDNNQSLVVPDDIITKLNQDYSPHNIYFNNSGFDYIDNSDYLDIVASEFNSLITINNAPNAINIYLVDSADFMGKAKGILSQTLVMVKEFSITGIISHEMGHCLNLLHTHDTQFGIEIQDDCSSGDDLLCNCTYAGDKVCDTPPDPNLKDNVNSSCQYVGIEGYNPDTENIMSYTIPSCLNHFTNEQAIRMRDAILNSPILQPVIDCNCSATAIFGKSTIHSTETTTYSLSCGTASFTTSSNLQTISTTSNSITVKPVNTSINDLAFVKVTVGGTVYQKDIWVGKPKIDLNLTSDVNWVFLDLVGVNSDIHKQNISSIEWEKLSVTGYAGMGTATNNFSNMAHGNTMDWVINARITVVNDCGITYLYEDITPEPIPCDDYYTVNKTNDKEYTINIIIDPCEETNTTSNKKEGVKIKDIDIIKAEIFDLHGRKVRSSELNHFNTEGLKHGIYIFRGQIKDKLIVKKIIVE